MMKVEKENRKEIIDTLNRRLKRKKYISILLALFTLGVNIFAWFAFSANVSVTVNGSVASWDVTFKDENEVVSRYFTVDVTQMKPGMNNFVKTITVENNSDVAADFRYEFVSFKLLGHSIDLSSKADPVDYLKNYYPFATNLISSNNTISAKGTITFDVAVIWPYESQTLKYYAQDEVYNYDEGFIYYKNNSGTYSPFEVPTANIYNAQKSSLFLEKDDADTYFGMQCHSYETSSGKPCLTLSLKLLVEQKLN